MERASEVRLTGTIHDWLVRSLSPGWAFLVRPPRLTASTTPLALLARSSGVLRSRTPRDGIHEKSGLTLPAKRDPFFERMIDGLSGLH